jgi:hypothetical protein
VNKPNVNSGVLDVQIFVTCTHVHVLSVTLKPLVENIFFNWNHYSYTQYDINLLYGPVLPKGTT